MNAEVAEAIAKLHEAARAVEKNVEVGDVSRSIRNAADQLIKIIQGKEDGTD